MMTGVFKRVFYLCGSKEGGRGICPCACSIPRFEIFFLFLPRSDCCKQQQIER